MNILIPECCSSNVGNGAMNTPQYWQRRNELFRDVGNWAMMLVAGLAGPGLFETSANTLAVLKKESRNLVQPLKKPTQVPAVPRAS